MADLNLTSLAQPFKEENAFHIERAAEVIIVKRQRTFVLPGATGSNTQLSDFLTDFDEFLNGPRKILIPNPDMDASWPDPDNSVALLYKHFQITASSGPMIGQNSTVDQTENVFPNTDVVSISATLTVEGRGQCRIVLSGRENKYVFQNHPLRNGDTIFESNDLIFVNISGLDNRLHRVFTGLITSVRLEDVVGDTLKTNIVLECDDMLKPLFESRTNVKPSIDTSEAVGKIFNGLAPFFGDKLPHEILSNIMARAYGDIFTVPDAHERLDFIRTGIEDEQDAAAAAILEEQFLEELVSLPSPASPEAIVYGDSSPFLAVQGSVPSVLPGLGPTARLSSQSVQIPKRIYGLRKRQPTIGVGTTDFDKAGRDFSVTPFADPDAIAFVIEGTNQPAFQLAFTGQTSLFASEWKSGLAVAKSIADDINWELFADADGIVRFRPINVALPHDFDPGQKAVPSDSIGQNDGRVGSEYWLDERFIQYSSYNQTDDGIFTIAYVIGDLQAAPLTPGLYKAVAIDAEKLERLGPRVAPPLSRLNLLTDEACQVYARAYLARLNAGAKTAQVIYTGDSRLRPGNSCYLGHRSEMYYVASVSHEFTVGGAYTTTLTLKYGRKPLGVRFETKITRPLLANTRNPGMRRLLQRYDILNVLSAMESAKQLDASSGVYLARQSEVQYITANLLNLSFGNYVWEPMYPLNYEMLTEGLIIAENTGKTKVAVENSKQKTADFKAKTKGRVSTVPTSPEVRAGYIKYMVGRSTPLGTGTPVGGGGGSAFR